jgi:S1-C subfamily serine protease
VNIEGEVVGIPTLTASNPEAGGVAPGIGFAIPSNVAKDLAQQMIEHGRVVNSHRAYLGIQSADVQGGEGVLVYAVKAGGPADKAGIKRDWLITAINGQPTPSAADLAAVLATLEPGQQVSVDLLSADGTKQTVHVTLGELPG